MKQIMKEAESLSDFVNRDIVRLKQNDTLAQAVEAKQQNADAVLVVVDDGDRPLGFIGDHELLSAFISSKPECTLLSAVMTTAQTLSDGCAVSEVEAFFQNKRATRLALINPKGGISAVLSILDFYQHKQQWQENTAVVRDITEQYASRISLLESENRFKNMLENAPFAIIVARFKDRTILYANRKIQTQYGFKPEEYLGRDGALFYKDRTDADRMRKILLHEGKVSDFETQVVDFNGNTYWALLSSQLISYENESAIMISINDIHKRKTMELRLADEQSRMDALLKAIPDPVWVKTRDGVYTFCNPMFERLYGTSAENIIGKTDFDFLDAEQAVAFQQNDQLTISSEKLTKFDEWLDYRDTGTRALFEVIKTPLHDSTNKTTGVLGIARDVTASRQNEVDLAKRVKEQKCLFDISIVTESLETPFDELLRQIALRIGSGWKYSEIAEARVEYSGAVYSST